MAILDAPTLVEDVVVTTIIPADYAPRCFDRVDGTLYVESVGDDSSHPYAVYGLTIFNFGTWRDVSVSPGNPDTYPADGRQVCIQNAGPSRIKLVYADPPTVGALLPKCPKDDWKTDQ